MSAPTRRLQQIIEEGRYAISGILGSGGMGIVYLARDRVLGREVALKVLREPYVRSEEFMERFRREANNAAALSHPNIVSVYDRGEPEEGPSYIAMEYVSGGTLTERISQGAPMPPDEAARIAFQVANALKEAHRHGLVHRDIKSENILLTEEGQVKVADFGIARAAEANALTHTGQVFGTVSYVSPEQAAGDRVGPESDLYSLGVLMYEMLTGEVPFKAESQLGVAMKHVREEPVPVGQKNPEVPEELAALTMALLSKDPAARPSPAGQVATRLELFLEGEAAVEQASALAVAPASASASGPVQDGEATRVMRGAAVEDAAFLRGRRAALLCAVAVLPLVGIFVLSRYDLAGQNTSGSFAPVVEPKASGVGAPDSSASVTANTSKQKGSAPEKRPSPPEHSPADKHSGSSTATSDSKASYSVASAAQQSTSSASATASATASAASSATPSATASAAAANSASTAAARPTPENSGGTAGEPAPAASPPQARAQPPQPRPAPKPAPKPVPSKPEGPVAPEVHVSKTQIQTKVTGSVPSSSGGVVPKAAKKAISSVP